MNNRHDWKRRRFLQTLTTVTIAGPVALFDRAAAAALGHESMQATKRAVGNARFGDAAIRIDIDHRMQTSIACVSGGQLTRLGKRGAAEYLVLADGSKVKDFQLMQAEESSLADEHGPGRRIRLTGLAENGIEKTVQITLYQQFPGFALYRVSYRNLSDRTLSVKGWTNGACRIAGRDTGGPAFWSFSGGSYADRRDWVQPVEKGFSQANFMGMTASDYGGGTPIVDVWRRDAGIAVGHVERTPKLVGLPLERIGATASIALRYEAAGSLAPGENLDTFETFVAVHRGDYFATLDTYRRLMALRGLHAPATPKASYEPIWCAWGYERNFTMALVEGTLDKARDLGLDWAVIDDGWQTANGDWHVDRKKFPRGEEDLKYLAQRIRAAGLKPRLWFSPLAVNPGTDLLHDHTDMLLLDKDGAVQNITWWNSFYLCPAYAPTVSYTQALVKKILGEWGFAGLKIDGQHLNGVAPCFNPAHKHARPEESVEKLQDFFKAIYLAAMEVNPDAVVELCPCGTSYAFHNMPYMNQAPASDPESSWQVRHKGKTLKALMGPSAPYAGDHVELSDGGCDFASTVGIGAIVSTKFTWPADPKPKDSFLLTADKEPIWRKWISLYRQHMLPAGTYRGDLYDIGFDKPEAHALEKDGRLYLAFYSRQWNGPVEIRGLRPGTGEEFAVHDYVNDRFLGTVTPSRNRLHVSFEGSLLVEVAKLEQG